MDNKLHELLSEVWEIQTDISCMVQILEALKVVYDVDNHFETRSCIEMCSTWVKCLENRVAAVGNELDVILLKNKNSCLDKV